MGKFISIPVEGATTTTAVIGAVTLTSGAITAIGGTGVITGAGYTIPPIVPVTSTDGKGSGAVIVASTLVSGAPSFAIISGGSGYTSASTVICTVSPSSILINADSVLSISPVATGDTNALNTTLVIKMNTASAPVLTLTLANPLSAAAPFATGADPIATKNAIINALMLATNVKIVDQVTPVILPSTVIVKQYAFA